MSERKHRRRFAIFLLSAILVFSPLNFSFFLNISSAEGEPLEEEIVGAVSWSGYRSVNGSVTVKPGATLTIGRGTIVEFDGKSQLEAQGTILVEGTPEHPVILRKRDTDEGDRYTVTAYGTGTVSVRNADVSGGGSADEAFLIAGGRKTLFRYADAAWFYSGAFSALAGGKLDIERTDFHGNPLAVYTDRDSYSRTKVWRSEFSGNGLDFVSGYTYGSGKSDIRYNWWGSGSGPEAESSEHEVPRPYEKIIGNVSVAPWAMGADTRDPVLVVPGTMGSWKKTQASELELDPILGIYDDLIRTLDENGYEEGADLFRFPYDWRESNATTASLLRTKIDAIKIQTGWPRVDIVAHSMGGIIAREYIRALGGDASVDQLITLGTPHKGSPKSYLIWEGGEFGIKFQDKILKAIFQQEAEENGYTTLFDYIRRRPIQSARELLPVYPYLRNIGEADLMSYAVPQYPRNTFLETLGTTASMKKLSGVSFTDIVGKTENDTTIENIRVDGLSIETMNDPEATVRWGHGKPDGYDSLFGGDRGLELGPGDGTVPFVSASGITADETIELPSDHGDLPSDGAEIVYRTLSGLETQSSIVKESQPESLLLVMPFSPVDIQVVSPSGLKVGKDFEGDGFLNQIPGAYYTGSDTKNEFVTIPNPEDGEYAILARGTDGGGTYRIEATKITETADGDATESTATIEGDAIAGAMEEEMAVEVSADTVELKDGKDIVAPTVTIASPEPKTYSNDEIIPVSYAVSDDVSPETGMTVAVSLDGEAYGESGIDASLLPLGPHAFSVSATDEAGNMTAMTNDFTLETSWDALLENIDHYAALGLLRNKGERQMMRNHIRNLGETVEFLETYDLFFRQHPRLRDIFEREIARQLSILQRYAMSRSGKSIDPIAAARLVESMEFLKNSL